MGLVKARANVAGTPLAFGAVTGSYQPLIVAAGGCRILTISNSLDKEMVISLDGGTTAFVNLQPAKDLTLLFGAAELQFSGTVSVKHNGVAPTSGAISAGAIFGG